MIRRLGWQMWLRTRVSRRGVSDTLVKGLATRSVVMHVEEGKWGYLPVMERGVEVFNMGALYSGLCASNRLSRSREEKAVLFTEALPQGSMLERRGEVSERVGVSGDV